MTISGKKIAQKRNKQKLSQEELADLVGVSQSIVSDWESSKCQPRPTYWDLIAQALHVELTELLEDSSVNIYHQASKTNNSINGNGHTINNDSQKLTNDLINTQCKLITKLEAENESKDIVIKALEAELYQLKADDIVSKRSTNAH